MAVREPINNLIQDAEQRFRATFERVPTGLALVDRKGRWLYVNQRLCSILGYTAEELLPESFGDVAYLADLELDLDRVEALLRGATRDYELEKRLARRDGDMVWCHITVAVVREPDQTPRYFILIFDDVSARKCADAVLGEAAHELRLPLSHIKGFISSLRRSDLEWDRATHDEYLEDIENEADRLALLIEDLLERAHAAPGPTPTRRRVTTSARALVQASLDRLRRELGARSVQIHVPADLPKLDVDGSAIERVLANLLDNANKYSPPNSPITISARVIGRTLELRVDDRGAGIAPDDYERIFEPFYRRRDMTSATPPGHGLGLAICRSIVAAHGGHIWAASRPGGGARFTVALPLDATSQRRSVRLPILANRRSDAVRPCGAAH
jgi:PAS domain S-box-containing protein